MVRGTAFSVQELFEAITGFMSNNGWVLLDDLGAADKVFQSTGTDGHKKVVRLFHDTDKPLNERLYKSATHINGKYDYIYAEGYLNWDSTSHTGLNKYGIIGPHIHTFGKISGDNYIKRIHDEGLVVLDPNDRVPIAGETLLGQGPTSTLSTDVWAFEGRRVYCKNSGSNNAFAYHDIPAYQWVGLTSPPGNPYVATLVYDSITDEEWVYLFGSTCSRYNIHTNTFQTLAPVPVTPSTYMTGVYDGGNFFYAQPTNSSAFYRYDIAANSWTQMASRPASSGNNSTTWSICVYVPASASGLESDFIYWCYLNGPTSTLHRYNVTTDTWTSFTGLPENHNTNAPFLAYDCVTNTLYYQAGGATPSPFWVWKVNLKDVDGVPTSGSWTPLGRLTGATSHITGKVVHDHACKIRGKNSEPVNYWIVGNSDRVSVFTKLNSGFSTWAHFGSFQSFHPTTRRTLTAPSVGHTPATFTVDSTEGIRKGDDFVLLDENTGATEKVTVWSVDSGTQFRAYAKNLWPTGTALAVEHLPIVFTGGEGYAVLPMDLGGYQSEHQPALNYVEPTANRSRVFYRNAPNGQGRVSTVPYVIYSPFAELYSYGDRGRLLGVSHVLIDTGTLETGSELVMDGKRYIVSECSPMNSTFANITTKKNYVVFGPIEE